MIFGVNPIREADKTPAATLPVGVAEAKGAVAEVLTKYSYPDTGAGLAAVQLIVAVVDAIALEIRTEGADVHGELVVKLDAPAHNEVVVASHLDRTQK